MTEYPEIAELMEQAEDAPDGSETVTLIEAALALAQQLGDERQEYDVRMELISALYYLDGAERTMLHFAWCLNYHDAHRDDFDWSDDYDLMWKYKWVLNAALQFPQIPLARVRALNADYAERVRAFGAGARTLPYEELALAEHLGDREAAQAAYPRWQYTPRDMLSDCEACEAHSMVTYQAFMGRDERALEAARPILSGEETCAHVPHITHTALLAPLVRLGRWEEAQEQCALAAPLVRGESSLIAAQAEVLAYLALTDRARAGRWYARHTGPALTTPEPLAALGWHAAAATYFQVLAGRQASVRLSLPQTVPLYRPDGVYQPAELADWHGAQARTLARRFDARAGNSYRMDDLAQRLGMAALAR